jgi:hypothetical protein
MAELRGPAAGQGYEPKDISVRVIVLMLLVFAIVASAAMALVTQLHPALVRQALREEPAPSAVETQAIEPPPIELQSQPLADIAALHAREDAILDHYGWVDQAHTIAHIPIDEAMKLTVGHSLDSPP